MSTVITQAEIKQALQQLGKRRATGRYRRRLALTLKRVKNHIARKQNKMSNQDVVA
jgi:hypothetical protein